MLRLETIEKFSASINYPKPITSSLLNDDELRKSVAKLNTVRLLWTVDFIDYFYIFCTIMLTDSRFTVFELIETNILA